MKITENLKIVLNTILQNLEKCGIDVSDLELDHFGYQAASSEDYESLKIDANQIGELMNESIVGGRRVGIYKLKSQIHYKQYVISGFELVEPKTDQKCISALDHVEFVLLVSFEEFIGKYPNIAWDTIAMNRTEFPKVALRFEDGSGVKFHQKNILKEIE